MTSVKIEMIHDLVCSWCPIGYQNLSTAIDRLEGYIDVSIEFLPFQLNPDMPYEGENINDHLARRMKKSPAELAEYRRNLLEVAGKAGVTFDFDKRTHYYNSFKAHCLLNAAQKHGQQRDALRLLHRAYYQEGQNLSDESLLAKIAKDIGGDSLLEFALSPSNIEETAAKETKARALNVQSVPAFIIDGQYLFHGSNSVEYFIDMLLKNSKAA